MSAEAKGKISVDDSSFKVISKRVENNFQKMGDTSKRSGDKIKQSSMDSGNAINNFKSKIPTTNRIRNGIYQLFQSDSLFIY